MKIETVYDTKLSTDLTIKIGKNAKENWELIDMANSYDYWFHLDDYPSCHVILEMPKDTEVSKTTLIRCASLCKKNSAYANESKLSIIYTQIKNVKKSKAVGSVTTRNTETIII